MFQIVYTSVHCYSSRPKKCWASRGEITNPEQIFSSARNVMVRPAFWRSFQVGSLSNANLSRNGKQWVNQASRRKVTKVWEFQWLCESMLSWAIPNLSHTKPEPYQAWAMGTSSLGWLLFFSLIHGKAASMSSESRHFLSNFVSFLVARKTSDEVTSKSEKCFSGVKGKVTIFRLF